MGVNFNRRIILLIASLVVVGILLITDRQSFGLSHESGFYEEPFELSIDKPFGTKVYYTLDGSAPTTDSNEYTGPLLIDDASNNPNVYANITEVVPNYGEAQWQNLQYVVPEDNIDKCNVVRAICVNKNGAVIDETEAVYFVGFDNKSGYDDMWICSIVTDPDNLFDSQKGIMVCGDAIEDDGAGHYSNANYDNAGFEWERVGLIQMYDPERNKTIDQMCGMRIHGHSSRSLATKSFNIYSRREYDGNDKFLCDFWGDGFYPEKFMLFSGGQDDVSMVRDRLMCDLTRNLNISSYHYVPCVLFLDGEYWGVYYICEKFDTAYLKHYFGVEKEEVIELKDFMQNPEWAITEGVVDMVADEKKWNDFAICVSAMEEMGLNQELFERTFDIESFLDYFSAQIYISRTGDWPPRNMAYWSTRCYRNGYNDGRWRFLLFDSYYDSMTYPDQDTISYARDIYAPLDYELSNEDIRQKFDEKIINLKDNVFTEENVNSYIENHRKLMREPLKKHYKRFYGDNITDTLFDEYLDRIESFFAERRKYFEGELGD